MKRTVKALALSIIFALTLFMSSCDLSFLPKLCFEHTDENGDGKCDVCGSTVNSEEKKPEKGPEKEPEKEPTKNPGELLLIEDGKANFQFVIATTAPKGATFRKTVDSLAKKLGNLGIEVSTVNETAENRKDCEIIFGIPTTRGDAYSYDIHTLGANGYLIKLIDGKIIIAGGSERATFDAIDIFAENILRIEEKSEQINNVSMQIEQSIEKIQDDYDITSLKLNGEDMRGYTIAVDSSDKFAKFTAEHVQNFFYLKTGYWFELVELDKAEKSIIIDVKPNTYEGDGFSISVDGSTLTVETEFPNKLQSEVEEFLAENITLKQGEVNLTKRLNRSINLRDLSYEQFGATSNGGADDDFQAIKACHDYANLWGHRVVARAGATYYIGKVPTGDSILIKTDVDWNNCKIILDDSQIGADDTNEVGRLLRGIPVIRVLGDYDYHTATSGRYYDYVNVTDKFAGRGLTTNETNIGFAPGFKALLHVLNNDVKHYIRYGINENSGAAMQEVIIVDEYGNISPETPLVWNYDVITSARIYCVDDRPITLKNLNLDNIANQAPNYYTSYARGICVERSNTTVKGIDHSILEEGPTRAPYAPTLNAIYCYNVTFEDCLLQHQENRYDADTGALLGTYELGGTAAVNITWRGCRQKNFFQADGRIAYQGLFGSNYCRNALLEDCFLNSFDAHCGLTNLTIRNSTFEHINCIGNGDVLIENVNVYTDGTDAIINLRSDYGSTWNGSVTIDGVHMKYMKNKPKLGIFQASYTDWDFGYQCYFPQQVILKNITSAKVAPTVPTSTRLESQERVIEENVIPIHLCADLEGWKLKDDLTDNINNYLGTKTLTITDCEKVPGWVFPNVPMFKDMQVYINGEKIIDWKSLYGSK